MARVPFSRQRRERLGLFSPVNLSFDPARVGIGDGRTVRSRPLLLVHLYAGSGRRQMHNGSTLPRHHSGVQTQ